jgi:hypothetical protein
MIAYYVIYDTSTGNVLFEGTCPEHDIPDDTTETTVLRLESRCYIPRLWKVIDGHIVPR